MDQSINQSAPIRSALFVDFDNIFIGLSKTDPQAAERFASDPARWLAWLESGLPSHSNNRLASPRPRSILIRRCYPNPDAGFRHYRSFFTSAAFSVIDCPSLTRLGKNSSDIYMVMDILDTLSHKTYFDEFIIFSGDSDFMPVLLRLRAHDRRTTTLAIDFMPPAYKAACDLVISEEDFIEDALGLSHENNQLSSRARVSMNLLKEMAVRVYEATCQAGQVDGADLPDILKDFREFRESNNWLGYGTSQRLAEALVAAEQRLDLVRINATMYKLVLKVQVVKAAPAGGKEKSLAIAPVEKQPAGKAEKAAEKPGTDRPAADKAADKPAAVKEKGGKAARAEKEAGGPVEKPAAGEKAPRLDVAQLRAQVLSLVKEIVTGSESAVLLARVSQQIVSRIGPQVLESQWAGAGSFKKLLQTAGDLGLEVTTQPEPGYIFDPVKHVHPQQRSQGEKPAVPALGSDVPEMNEQSSAPETMPESAVLASAEVVTVADEPQEAPALPELPEMAPVESMPDAVIPVVFTPVEARGYDRSRGYDDAEEEEDDSYDEETPPSLEEFIRRVSRVTGAPDLTPQQYATVFRGIVNELQLIAAGQKSYTTYQSSKAVAEWCADQGSPVSRSDIVLILKGIIFQDGVRFGKRPGSYSERELAEVVCNNIRALCRRSQLELSEYENRLLEEWILGEVETAVDAAPVESNDNGHEGDSEENSPVSHALETSDTQSAEAEQPPAGDGE